MGKTAVFLAGTQISPSFTANAGKDHTGPLVLRVSSTDASRNWDYAQSAPWDHTVEPKTIEEFKSNKFRKDRYFDAINEDILLGMISRGVMELAEEKSTRAAWKKILPNYQKKHKITVKVNLNNASYNDKITTNRMDQSAPAINALLASLFTSLNVPEENITVADPSRWIHPEIIKERCRYKKINWVDSQSENLWDIRESVEFSHDQPIRPKNKPHLPETGTFHIARAYTEADHIINFFLFKNHGCGVTGAMKNHFGAIPPPFPKYLHDGLGSKSYIADLCNTRSIKQKVRINICEAVFGNWHNNVWSPRPWKTFPGGTPNSLFFSTDPVAIDSVLLQHITDEIAVRGKDVEEWVRQAVKDHQFLHYAMQYHKLGVHEHKPFNSIEYRNINLA